MKSNSVLIFSENRKNSIHKIPSKPIEILIHEHPSDASDLSVAKSGVRDLRDRGFMLRQRDGVKNNQSNIYE